METIFNNCLLWSRHPDNKSQAGLYRLEADRIAKTLGAVMAGEYRVTNPRYNSGVPMLFSVYYFDIEGGEIGNYSIDMESFTHHARPRIHAESYKQTYKMNRL